MANSFSIKEHKLAKKSSAGSYRSPRGHEKPPTHAALARPFQSLNPLIYYPYLILAATADFAVAAESFALQILRALRHFLTKFTQQNFALLLTRPYRIHFQLGALLLVSHSMNVVAE